MHFAARYLGVDGGYSGTRALLIDEGASILGFGYGGNANHATIGYPQAVANVMDSVSGALSAAGVELGDLTMIEFALAGDDVIDDHLALSALLDEILDGVPYELCNDVWAGLRAGSLDGTGVAVNCGSGTGAVGRNRRGQSLIIPDLGYMFGDSGGSGQISRDAIRAVVRAWDGRGKPTRLTNAVLGLLGLSSTEALYLALYRNQIGEKDLRQCMPIVLQVAAHGDEVALEILQRVGDEFGVSACALTRRLSMEDEEFPFVLTGGGVRTLRSPMAEAAVARLRAVAPKCMPTLPLLMPVGGAALMALDGAGVTVTREHFERLQNQGQAWYAEELPSE